ncbi:AraC-type DNA-binding protein [Mesorhizobium albiziae]|uniref:AraC-type DNA-binding protein n=2 Tax=Neomesorhizobium albiziae TaxID=335020 RepID=A0A1I4DPT3_9HYPH|nr:AraC family transcriptional regulator [Mesorhizobium albiziae]SFK94660.1 AraC-type DNA-binding protein [Mesorhizobium albiziae]
MNFSPKMRSVTHGFSVVGGLKWRLWKGVVADVWDVDCAHDASGDYVSPDPRLFVALELGANGSFIVDQPDARKVERHDVPLSMSFVPAGMPIRGRVQGLTRMKHLDLHFSETALLQRFGRAIDRQHLLEPRLSFREPRIAGLAVAIAAECDNADPLHDLYGEGLINALLALLFDIRTETGRRRPALSRHQVRLVTGFIEEHCLETIRLSDLAALVGLSESYFSHAFKAATGVPPHRWHTQARIRHVQRMLSSPGAVLTEVAAAAGFSDQAHLSRVFKATVGVTPSTWMRATSRSKQ